MYLIHRDGPTSVDVLNVIIRDARDARFGQPIDDDDEEEDVELTRLEDDQFVERDEAGQGSQDSEYVPNEEDEAEDSNSETNSEEEEQEEEEEEEEDEKGEREEQSNEEQERHDEYIDDEDGSGERLSRRQTRKRDERRDEVVDLGIAPKRGRMR